MIRVKRCVICKKFFTKNPSFGVKQWRRQKYCSQVCRSKGFKLQVGVNNPNWKGGRYTDFDGYVYVRSPKDHPHKIYNGYIFEHRLVAENKIGRFLKENEKVHHINGVKSDNRPDNIVVITQSEHIAIHRKELNEKRWPRHN